MQCANQKHDKSKSAPHHPCCPRAQKSLRDKLRSRWLIWLLPVAGLVSLIWFLIRVIPKPSRALYPCQRVAMPLASSFVAWLIGIAGSVVAFRRTRGLFRQARVRMAVACLAAAVVFGAVAIRNMPETNVAAAEADPLNPIGAGRGIHPGRVVWVHDPEATDWDGPGQGHLWEPAHTNQAVCYRMMSQALQTLTGRSADAAAWDALFRHHNEKRGKGNAGYKDGEKIMIKVNFVGFIRTHGGVNPETYDLESWVDYMNTSPQMIAALIKQLTQAGVPESNIAVGDSLAYFANEYYDMLHERFPRVQYLDCKGKYNRGKMELSKVPLHWSCQPKDCKQDYLPRSFADADYIINLANLKAHPGSGVTLCAKNHYGSLVRLPPERGYYDMHGSAFSKGTGQYDASDNNFGPVMGRHLRLVYSGLQAS